MKIRSTLIVGAGGIGSHLAEPLARLLKFHPNGTLDMLIVDGDKYEEKNAARQMFPLEYAGAPKAAVLRSTVENGVLMQADIERCLIREEFGYVSSPDDAANLMLKAAGTLDDEGDEAVEDQTIGLVCLCVDNDATRRLFYDGIADLPMTHRSIAIIDCGNDLETATVSLSFWEGRKSLLTSPVEKYENLRNPKDRIPGGGCQELAPSTPQLMVANMSAAFMALLLVQALLDGNAFSDDLVANVRTFTVGVSGGLYGGGKK